MPETNDAVFWEKLARLVAEREIVIDRPRGSAHPRYGDCIYPLDYGYLAGTTASDGAALDVWVGSGSGRQISGILCTVDLVKHDAEIKVLIDCADDEIGMIMDFHTSSVTGCCLLRR